MTSAQDRTFYRLEVLFNAHPEYNWHTGKYNYNSGVRCRMHTITGRPNPQFRGMGSLFITAGGRTFGKPAGNKKEHWFEDPLEAVKHMMEYYRKVRNPRYGARIPRQEISKKLEPLLEPRKLAALL